MTKRKFSSDEDPVGQLLSKNLKRGLFLEELILLCAYYKADRKLSLAQALDKLLQVSFISPKYDQYATYVYKKNIQDIKELDISLDFNWYDSFKKIRNNCNEIISHYRRVDWLIGYGLPDYAFFITQLCPKLMPPESKPVLTSTGVTRKIIMEHFKLFQREIDAEPASAPVP